MSSRKSYMLVIALLSYGYEKRLQKNMSGNICGNMMKKSIMKFLELKFRIFDSEA